MGQRDKAYPRAMRYAVVSAATNVALATGKLVAGWLGGSFALIADGFNSLSDLAVSGGIWLGLRIASRPADDNHPYGHGKVEQEVSRLVAVVVLVAGGAVLFAAYHRLDEVHGPPAPYVMLVAGLSIPIKLFLARYADQEASRHGSGAVRADAVNHLGDVGATFSVLLGAGIVYLMGESYSWVDDVAAGFVGAAMVWMAAWEIHSTSRELLDEMPPDEIVTRVMDLTTAFPGVSDVEKIAGRKSGLHYYLDLHLEVPGTMSVQEAHALSHRVKDWVMAAMHEIADVVIHIEPESEERNVAGNE